MGILIVLGLAVIVWKVIDLAKQKAAREKSAAARQEQLQAPQQLGQLPDTPFAFDYLLESGQRILETTAAPGGLWIRIGADGMTHKIILIDYAGKVIGAIQVKRDETAQPAR